MIQCLPESLTNVFNDGKMGADFGGFWRKANTSSVSEKLLIHLPGDEFVTPTSLAQRLTANTNGLTLSSISPII